MLNQTALLKLLRSNSSINILSDIKKEIFKLSNDIITENSDKSKGKFNFYELANNYNDKVYHFTNQFIEVHSLDYNSLDIESFDNIVEMFENLFSKSLHSVFFQYSLNEFQILNYDSFNNNIGLDKDKDKKLNEISKVYNKTNELNKDFKNLFFATKLYKEDMIFEKKCSKFYLLNQEDLGINKDIDLIFCENYFKSKFLLIDFYGIYYNKSAREKLNCLMNIYKLYIYYFENENSQNFNMLLRFIIFILLKKNFPRFISIFNFIKVFRIKGITSSIEDYFIHAVEKACETIYLDFNLNVNNLIRIDSNRLKEILLEQSKKELLDKNFKSNGNLSFKGKFH